MDSEANTKTVYQVPNLNDSRIVSVFAVFELKDGHKQKSDVYDDKVFHKFQEVREMQPLQRLALAIKHAATTALGILITTTQIAGSQISITEAPIWQKEKLQVFYSQCFNKQNPELTELCLCKLDVTFFGKSKNDGKECGRRLGTPKKPSQ